MKRRFTGESAEDGSILPLIFGFFALALALVLVATAATSLYLERSRLYTLADGAALAAADSLALAAAATGDAPAPVDDTPRAAASAYLTAATAARRAPVTLVSVTTPDAHSAEVRLQATWRPPLLTPFLPAGLRIEVTARARPVFW